MFRKIQIALALVALCGVTVTGQAALYYGDPTVWDVLDENYGSGSGQISFNGSYAQTYWGTTTPTETLSDGKATLDVAAGTHAYAVKESIPSLNIGGADCTIEFKMASPTKDYFNTMMSETNSSSTNHWNFAMLINGLYDGYKASDSLADYAKRQSGVSEAPAGFDGGIAHTYRVVRSNGATQLHLDGNPTPLLTLQGGVGAAGDGANLEWGFFAPSGSSATFDAYYLKVATGAYAPVPEPSTFALLMAGVVGFVAYAWRKRR